MPVSGLTSQLGLAIEETPGTRVAPSRFLEFNSESLQLNIDRIQRDGMRAGRRLHHGWSPGVYQTGGQVSFDLSAGSTGALFRACLGTAAAPTGSDPYTHVFTPGALPSMSLQVGRPTVPFDYVGSYVSSWSLSANPNEHVQMQVDFVGMEEERTHALASATYAQGAFFTFVHGALTVAGDAKPVDTVSLSCDNSLSLYHQIKSANAGRPSIFENGRRMYTGTVTTDFENLTDYNRFVNATEAALVLTFNAGASAILTITANVRFDGTTPNVSGPEIVKQELPFTMTSNTSDAAALTVSLVNADSTI
jgi:hypothetical protein